MDNETVDKKGGKVTEFSIHVSRKVTDNNYGSFEVSIGETVSVGSEEDYVELERECFKELKEKVLKAAVLDNTNILTLPIGDPNLPEIGSKLGVPPEVDDHVPPPPDPDTGYMEEEVRIPIDDKGQEKIVFLAEKINIYAMPSGDKGAKIKGKVVNPGKHLAHHGNYMKYGVQAWPEVIAKEPLEWDLATMEVGEIDAPPGLTAICLTKETEKGELQATKVEKWE